MTDSAMIENQFQYELTRKRAGEFARTLVCLHTSTEKAGTDAIHPLLRQAERDALASQLESFKEELAEYESQHNIKPIWSESYAPLQEKSFQKPLRNTG